MCSGTAAKTLRGSAGLNAAPAAIQRAAYDDSPRRRNRYTARSAPARKQPANTANDVATSGTNGVRNPPPGPPKLVGEASTSVMIAAADEGMNHGLTLARARAPPPQLEKSGKKKEERKGGGAGGGDKQWPPVGPPQPPPQGEKREEKGEKGGGGGGGLGRRQGESMV